MPEDVTADGRAADSRAVNSNNEHQQRTAATAAEKRTIGDGPCCLPH